MRTTKGLAGPSMADIARRRTSYPFRKLIAPIEIHTLLVPGICNRLRAGVLSKFGFERGRTTPLGITVTFDFQRLRASEFSFIDRLTVMICLESPRIRLCRGRNILIKMAVSGSRLWVKRSP